MLKSLRFTAAPFVVLLALMSGCSVEQTQATSPSTTDISPSPTNPAPISVPAQAPSAVLEEPFQDGLDIAVGAATIAQSAVSKDDWDLIVSRWQEAIKLMQAVPESSRNYGNAKKNIKKYQQNLDIARQNRENNLSPSSSTQQALSSTPNFKLEPTASQSESIASSSPIELMEAFIEQYFDATINKGSKGYEYWCSDFTRPESVLSPVSIITPRSWTVLNIELESRGANKRDGRGDFIGDITARVESSNRGGNPIINNWSFNLVKENPKLKNTFPGKYCITSLSVD